MAASGDLGRGPRSSLTARVAGAKRQTDSAGSEFTTYRLEVCRAADNFGGEANWFTDMRFSDFATFRAAWLLKLKGDERAEVESIAFPSKIAVGSSEMVVEGRKTGLEAWITTLLGSPELEVRWHNELLVFLGVRAVVFAGLSDEGTPTAATSATLVALSPACYPPCTTSSTTSVHCVKEGILKKMAISQVKAKNWKKRHFRLFWLAGAAADGVAAASLTLAYYAPGTTPTIASTASAIGRTDAPKGILHLGGMAFAERRGAMGSRKFPFQVTVRTADSAVSRKFLFNADLASIADSWVDTINSFSAALRLGEKEHTKIRASIHEAKRTSAVAVEKERPKAATMIHNLLPGGSVPGGLSAKKEDTALRYRLFTWGYNKDGQLANGDAVDVGGVARPKSVAFFERKRTQPAAIAVGSGTMVAITVDGLLTAWGGNAEGLLGDGGKQTRAQRPTFVKFPGATKESPIRVASVAFGSTFALALIDDGTGSLMSWGTDPEGHGVLGLSGGVASVTFPTAVVFGGGGAEEGIARIACGPSHAAAITASGAVYSWGCGEGGRLGCGNETSSATPALVSAPGEAFAVACSASATIVLTGHTPRPLWIAPDRPEEGGTALMCGRLLSDSSLSPPALRLAPLPAAYCEQCVAAAADGFHAMLLTESGTVLSWGDAPFHGLAASLTADAALPTLMKELKEAEIVAVAIACGEKTSCVLTQPGNILGWGENKNGQCGNGTFLKQPLPGWVMEAKPTAAMEATAFPLSTRFVSLAISSTNGAGLVVHDASGVPDRTAERERFFDLTGRGRSKPATTEELRAVFNAFDTDGGGDVSVVELAQMLKKLGVASTPDSVAAMLAKYDADGNGVLDFEEFTNLAKELVLTAYADTMALGGGEEEEDMDMALMASFNAEILAATVSLGSSHDADASSGAAPPPPPPDGAEKAVEVGEPEAYFYTDVEDGTTLHGPFTAVELRQWFDGGHFKPGDLVRLGRDGEETIPIDVVGR